MPGPLMFCRPARHEAAIGLGSNLGDRRRAIESALAALRDHRAVEVIAVSSIIETEPEGAGAGPRPFLNAAAILRTSLLPRALLETCQAIEAALGRTEPRAGPRTIDIDILLYGSILIDEPGLTIPHPRLPQRLFALIPLAEIADSWVHPRLGTTIQCLRDELARLEYPKEWSAS